MRVIRLRLPSRKRKEKLKHTKRNRRKRRREFLCSIFLFLCCFLQTRPIALRETEILNWKRPRAGATFIIPWSMIKIKSPTVSEAGNRCAGKNETKRKSEREPIVSPLSNKVGERRGRLPCFHPSPFSAADPHGNFSARWRRGVVEGN